MEYYDSYYDEDVDEAYDDSYEDGGEDYYEDYDEADGEYGEGRKERKEARQQRRQGRRDRRAERKANRRGGRGGRGPGRRPAPAPAVAVEKALDEVGSDVSELRNKVKKTERKQSNELWNEMLALLLFRPTLQTETYKFELVKTKVANEPDSYSLKITTPDGHDVKDNIIKVGTGLDDNMLPQAAVKLVGNLRGPDSGTGLSRFLPIAAGVALAPKSLSNLGINLGSNASAGNTGTTGSLFQNPTILILLAALLLNK